MAQKIAPTEAAFNFRESLTEILRQAGLRLYPTFKLAELFLVLLEQLLGHLLRDFAVTRPGPLHRD